MRSLAARIFTHAVSLVVSGSAFVACAAADDPDDRCTPGTTTPCVGPDGCAGMATCEEGSTAQGPCLCSETPGTDGGVPEVERLGNACDEDAQCPAGSFCLTEAAGGLFGGSSAVGICVADCSVDPGVCDDYASAVCVEVSTPDTGDGGAAQSSALCFERCTLGDGLGSKCHELDNVACDLALDAEGMIGGPSDGFCRPLCVTDDDCGSRTCDRRYGVCRDTPPTRSLALGSPCDPVADDNDCEGVCLEIAEGVGICSHRCEFGDTAECDATATGGGERTAGCLLVSEKGTLEDVGYCAPLCDEAGQCSAPLDRCEFFEDEVLEGLFGRGGVCLG